MPMWLCAWRAASSARSRSTPLRATSRSATSSMPGTRSRTERTRDRIVGSRSASLGAQRIHTVRSGGSSSALSNTFDVRSVMRSASSIDDDAPSTHRGRVVRRGDELADLVDGDDDALGREDGDVRVRVRGDLPERVVVVGPGADERRGEGGRHVGPARSGRTGDEPRVGHAAGAVGRLGGVPQRGHRFFLPGQAVPDAHSAIFAATTVTERSRPTGRCRRGSLPAPGRSGRPRRPPGTGRVRRRPSRGTPGGRSRGTPRPRPRVGRTCRPAPRRRERVPGHVEVEQHRGIGQEPVGGPAETLRTWSAPRPRATPW